MSELALTRVTCMASYSSPSVIHSPRKPARELAWTLVSFFPRISLSAAAAPSRVPPLPPSIPLYSQRRPVRELALTRATCMAFYSFFSSSSSSSTLSSTTTTTTTSRRQSQPGIRDTLGFPLARPRCPDSTGLPPAHLENGQSSR